MEVFILLLIFLHLKYQNISTSFYKLKNNITFRDLLAVAFSHELSAFEHMVTGFKKVSTEIHIQFCASRCNLSSNPMAMKRSDRTISCITFDPKLYVHIHPQIFG